MTEPLFRSLQHLLQGPQLGIREPVRQIFQESSAFFLLFYMKRAPDVLAFFL